MSQKHGNTPSKGLWLESSLALSAQKSQKSHMAKGFMEGFGCVQYVFRTSQPSYNPNSLSEKMLRASSSEREIVACTAKQQIVAKYLGNKIAARICLSRRSAQRLSARRADAINIHRDHVAAIARFNDEP